MVVRGVWVLEKDEQGVVTVIKLQMRIALARCPVCKSRLRILPADILPYKHYSLEVVNEALRKFARAKRRRDLLQLQGKVRWEGNIDELRKRI